MANLARDVKWIVSLEEAFFRRSVGDPMQRFAILDMAKGHHTRGFRNPSKRKQRGRARYVYYTRFRRDGFDGGHISQNQH